MKVRHAREENADADRRSIRVGLVQLAAICNPVGKRPDRKSIATNQVSTEVRLAARRIAAPKVDPIAATVFP